MLDLLGYRHTKEGELIIQPEEAKTVRFIFLAYIGGYDCDEIAEILTERERPTLRGRTDWNASMVMNIMSNERRWGDLEARKTIVIDYVEHKSKKNEHDRVSAYEEDHHEPIVSREIALAAQMIKKSSRKMTEGVPDFSVIHKGNLKGFVSICPGWGGIDGSALLEICQEVYEEEELEELNHKIRLFEGVKHVLTVVNTEKKRLAVVPCAEEESASVEWARVNKQGKWVNKNITSVDFVENLYHLMGWNRECRYKVLGRVAASDRGLILVFEMEEAIMFAPKKEEFVDPVTGETKKRQVKYYPDAYKNRIGRSYTEYEQYHQLNLFEDFGNYNKEQQPEHENSIGNNTEGTEAPMGATVPDYRIENQPQSNVNIEEGVDDNGNNEENTSTNFGITGQMGFH